MISIILPAKNEENVITQVITQIKTLFPDAELIVVNDGSTDSTALNAIQAGARVVSHPLSLGNGAAIKTGARAAQGEILVFLDADGQHPPEHIPRLLEKLQQGYDMAVGARDRQGQASMGRALANGFYNRFAGWMANYQISDLTSGFRAVYKHKFREFLHLLPNGFSYPTTITMAFMRSAYPVAYVPVPVMQRIGKSHIKPIRDGIRFLLIIFRIATLYSPLKIFAPVSAGFFLLGFGNYVHTFITENRFTNMSALLMSASVIIFLIGLVSEQITGLLYAHTHKNDTSP